MDATPLFCRAPLPLGANKRRLLFARRLGAPGLVLVLFAGLASPVWAADEPEELFGVAADEAARQGKGQEPVAPMAPTAPVAPAAGTAPAAPGASAPPGSAAVGFDGPGGPEAAPGPAVDVFPSTQGTVPGAPNAADPPARIGRLGFFSGRVSVRAGTPGEDAGGVWLEASRNRPVVVGDSLWADHNSRVELHLGSLEVRLGSDTLLQVLLLDDAHVRLALLQGTLAVRRHAQAPGAPTGAIEVCPPGMLVTLETAGSYRFDVGSDGRLNNLSATGGGRARAQAEHQAVQVAGPQRLQATADAGQGLQLQQAAPVADAFASWDDERAQAQNTAASLRYVSRDMVGYEDLDGYGSWTSSPTYGPLWAPRDVSAGWAPFRYGHWSYVSPWGWTWVDDAPWGFAPFHYGRWVSVRSRWFWAPGPYVAYPTYAPHLVAFAGGANFGAGIGVGAGNGYVGWYPLGFYDPFYPSYGCSYGYARGLNGPRPLPHFGQHGPAYGRGPRGVGGPRVPGSATFVPRQTVFGGLPVGPSHRPFANPALARGGRGGWGAQMPVHYAGHGPAVVGGPRPGFPPAGARPNAAMPPVNAWARGGAVVRGPGGQRLDGPRPIPQRGGPVSMPQARPQAGGYRAMPAYRFEPHYEQHGGGPRPGGPHFGPQPHFGGGPHPSGGRH